MNLPAKLALALVPLAACGVNVTVDGTGGSTTTGTPTTGTTPSGTTTVTGTGPCPASEPAGGESCAGVPDPFNCSYGSSVRPECRDLWTCSGGTWTTAKTACVDPPPGACPASEPGTGVTCGTGTGDVCVYGETLCYCGCYGGDFCGAPYQWVCAPPPTTTGCPAVAPNAGTPCSGLLQCVYGAVCSPDEAVATCTLGFWQWSANLACGG
jgi:hypothetical protein